jgi:hypothetical protein
MANATTASSSGMFEGSKGLNVALWIVQWFLAIAFVSTGIWKLVTPIPQLAEMMPWMGEVTPEFLYMTAVADLLVGFGILLPSLTRIAPGLTVWAAYACAALMAAALFFHLSRGEGESAPFNLLLLALALFVAWGRYSKAQIQPRPRD